MGQDSKKYIEYLSDAHNSNFTYIFHINIIQLLHCILKELKQKTMKNIWNTCTSKLMKSNANIVMRRWLVGYGATFNNISIISWWSVLLVEETGVPGENHQPVASH